MKSNLYPSGHMNTTFHITIFLLNKTLIVVTGEPSMPEFVHNEMQAAHPLSEQADSGKTLPPPNRFKKDMKIIADPEHWRRIQAYKHAHRRETVELEHKLSGSPASSPKLNADEWLQVFQMKKILFELTER